MKEDLLHFVWRYRKYPLNHLFTTLGESLRVLQPGTHNQHAGPDFFNAQLHINEQLWAGNVEIHLKASDWYAHHHQIDPNYNNVILHVVWEDDVAVFRSDGSIIPTLCLKEYIPKPVLDTYQRLFDAKNYQFINCEREIGEIGGFVLNQWSDRLFIERLEHKSRLIYELLEFTNNDWEYVLFLMLLKNFGSKINGDLFLQLGKSMDFSIIRKLAGEPLKLESLFMGQAGLLHNENIEDSFYRDLKKEYTYLKHKYQLKEQLDIAPAFFKLRPSNFPTIRLSQMAQLYAANHQLFQSVMEPGEHPIAHYFAVGTSSYWDDHYTFGKTSKKAQKKLTSNFIELILINTIVPLKFCYERFKGNRNTDEIFAMMDALKKENNSIIDKFDSLGVNMESAKTSQAFLQLYTYYCTHNKCLDCAIGARLMNIKG